MIRTVSPDELPELSGLGEFFFKTLGLPGEFNKNVFYQSWLNLIGSGAGFILGRFVDGAIVEAIGAAVFPDMQTGELTSGTLFWYALPSAGLAAGVLVPAMEKHWRTMGVRHCFFGVLASVNDKVGGFLVRNGYSLDSMQYRKAL